MVYYVMQFSHNIPQYIPQINIFKPLNMKETLISWKRNVKEYI